MKNSRSWIAWGDSLTYGYGLSEADQWVTQVSKKFRKKILNYGVSGSTLIEGQRFFMEILNRKPEVVLINFGTNDAILNEDANTRTDLRTFRKQLRSNLIALKLRGIEVILITVHQIIEGNSEAYYYSRHKPEDYRFTMTPNSVLKDFANCVIGLSKELDIVCIDLYNDPLMKPLTKTLISLENSEESDGVHYSKEGAKHLAMRISDLIKKEKINDRNN